MPHLAPELLPRQSRAGLTNGMPQIWPRHLQPARPIITQTPRMEEHSHMASQIRPTPPRPIIRHTNEDFTTQTHSILNDIMALGRRLSQMANDQRRILMEIDSLRELTLQMAQHHISQQNNLHEHHYDVPADSVSPPLSYRSSTSSIVQR